jgi:hypothetical protein
MTVPFRVDPESVRRQPPQDPFLEFESERPSRALLGTNPNKDESERSESPEDARPHLGLSSSERVTSEPRERSAISPSIAFAVGVAGLVTAAVGYYQMGQLLADRSQPPAATATTLTSPGSSVPSPVTPAAPATARLEIASDPAGAAVKVDGTALGVTPLTLPEFKPGKHEIVLTRGNSTVTRTVNLTAGGNALVTAVLAAPAVAPSSASAPRPAAAPVNAGWVTFDSPIELRVLSRGQPAGSTRGRVALAAGAHEFELISDLYEVRQTVSARVTAGQGTRLAVPLPTGQLSINALPWADVWIDGSPVGTTPLANLNFKVGTHQVILRHPTLGERQQTVLVKAVTPTRIGVNFSR